MTEEITYWPAEGFAHLQGLKASSACKGDSFYFPSPLSSVYRWMVQVELCMDLRTVLIQYILIPRMLLLSTVTSFYESNKCCCCTACFKSTVPVAVLLKSMVMYFLKARRDASFFKWFLWSFISKHLISRSISHYKYLAAFLCLWAPEAKRGSQRNFRSAICRGQQNWGLSLPVLQMWHHVSRATWILTVMGARTQHGFPSDSWYRKEIWDKNHYVTKLWEFLFTILSKGSFLLFLCRYN